MALFGRRRADRERVDEMAREVAELRDRLDRAAGTHDELREQVASIGSSNLALRGDLKDLRERGDEVAARLDELVGDLTRLDERATSISTELGNQLTELGRELDALSRAAEAAAEADEPAPTDVVAVREMLTEVLDEIHAGQERLASEQARYQIQFRRDLADLAERLRRPRPG